MNKYRRFSSWFRGWIRRSTKFRLNFHLKEFILVENRIKCLEEIFEMHDSINIYKVSQCFCKACTFKLNIFESLESSWRFFDWKFCILKPLVRGMDEKSFRKKVETAEQKKLTKESESEKISSFKK
jgi:hypothetical protein